MFLRSNSAILDITGWSWCWTFCALLTIAQSSLQAGDRRTSPGSFLDTTGICNSQGFFRNETDCSRFYRCVRYDPSDDNEIYTVFQFQCGPGTVFDQIWAVCVWPYQARPPCTLLNGTTPPPATTVTVTSITTVICAKLVNVTGPCQTRRDGYGSEDGPEVLSFSEDLDPLVDFLYSPPIGVEVTEIPRHLAVISHHAELESSQSEPEDHHPASARRVTRTVTVTWSTTEPVFILKCTQTPFPLPVCPKKK